MLYLNIIDEHNAWFKPYRNWWIPVVGSQKNDRRYYFLAVGLILTLVPIAHIAFFTIITSARGWWIADNGKKHVFDPEDKNSSDLTIIACLKRISRSEADYSSWNLQSKEPFGLSARTRS